MSTSEGDPGTDAGVSNTFTAQEVLGASSVNDRADSGAVDGEAEHSGTRWIYQRGAWLYRQAGWPGVLPLPPGKKWPPPVGFTGNDGRWTTDDDIAGFIATHPLDSNILVRLGYGSAALDVDGYDDKTGGRTIEEAERRWGPLPPTWRSTSRLDDPVSGILLFKVPGGLRFEGGIKFPEMGLGHVDIIQPHHRFVVCWPSVKDNRLTRWFSPAGDLVDEGVVPEYDDWPELPGRWVEELARDSLHEEVFDGSAPDRSRAARSRINHELYQRLIALDDNRSPDSLVASLLERALAGLTNGCGSRYDTIRDHVIGLMRYHSYGRAGVPRALQELYAAYVMEVGDTRPREVAEQEFVRFAHGAALLVSSSMPSMPDRNTKSDNASGIEGQQGEEAFEQDVAVQLDRLRVQAEARRRLDREKQGPAPPLDIALLGDVLARPSDLTFRVEGLIPSRANTLVVAQRKMGKTTLIANLARCLTTECNNDFLGRFAVRPISGRVAILNYEVTDGQMEYWCDQAGVPHDRLVLVNLRERRNPLNFGEDREILAAGLADHDVETLIVDPFAKRTEVSRLRVAGHRDDGVGPVLQCRSTTAAPGVEPPGVRGEDLRHLRDLNVPCGWPTAIQPGPMAASSSGPWAGRD